MISEPVPRLTPFCTGVAMIRQECQSSKRHPAHTHQLPLVRPIFILHRRSQRYDLFLEPFAVLVGHADPDTHPCPLDRHRLFLLEKLDHVQCLCIVRQGKMSAMCWSACSAQGIARNKMTKGAQCKHLDAPLVRAPQRPFRSLRPKKPRIHRTPLGRYSSHIAIPAAPVKFRSICDIESDSHTRR